MSLSYMQNLQSRLEDDSWLIIFSFLLIDDMFTNKKLVSEFADSLVYMWESLQRPTEGEDYFGESEQARI